MLKQEWEYFKTHERTLWDVYKTPSRKKQAIWKALMLRYGRVVVYSKTVQFFTVLYIDEEGNFCKDTGMTVTKVPVEELENDSSIL